MLKLTTQSMHYERAPRFRRSKLDVAPPVLRYAGGHRQISDSPDARLQDSDQQVLQIFLSTNDESISNGEGFHETLGRNKAMLIVIIEIGNCQFRQGSSRYSLCVSSPCQDSQFPGRVRHAPSQYREEHFLWFAWDHQHKRILSVGRQWPSANPCALVCDEEANNQNRGWTVLSTVVICG